MERQQRILIVDDDRQVAKMLSFNLKLAGFRVTMAFSGVSAIMKASGERPDLILMD